MGNRRCGNLSRHVNAFCGRETHERRQVCARFGLLEMAANTLRRGLVGMTRTSPLPVLNRTRCLRAS